MATIKYTYTDDAGDVTEIEKNLSARKNIRVLEYVNAGWPAVLDNDAVTVEERGPDVVDGEGNIVPGPVIQEGGIPIEGATKPATPKQSLKQFFRTMHKSLINGGNEHARRIILSAAEKTFEPDSEE
ncbi:MAG: hypothetical protein GY941_19905 [Planctomycetes bacterium]|nr:hypothetical protein [Planctomycetota bacterium]